MISERIEALLPDFWEGRLPEREREEVLAWMAANPAAAEEVRALEAVWQGLSAWADERPSPQLETRFNAMLSAYERGLKAQKTTTSPSFWILLKQVWGYKPAWNVGWQLGFATACLVMGLGLGKGFWGRDEVTTHQIAQLQQQVDVLNQKMTISMLEQNSAAERLAGIDRLRMVAKPTDETLQALVHTLAYDPNVNVRLAAADALMPYLKKDANLQTAFAASFKKQDSPVVQSYLIDILAQDRGKDSIRLLEEVREQTAEPMVREQIDTCLNEIK